jgi:hypothetical protein
LTVLPCDLIEFQGCNCGSATHKAGQNGEFGLKFDKWRSGRGFVVVWNVLAVEAQEERRRREHSRAAYGPHYGVDLSCVLGLFYGNVELFFHWTEFFFDQSPFHHWRVTVFQIFRFPTVDHSSHPTFMG